MKATLTTRSSADRVGAAPQRDLELPGLVPLSWSVAGGMIAGGAVVAFLIMTSRLSGHALLAASAVAYAAGALFGLVHGAILGIFGRPEGTTPRQALRSMARGLIFLAPALLVGWLAAGWVAALPIALMGHHVVASIITLVAWLLMAVVVGIAGTAGIDAIRLAFRRWPDRVAGSVLVSATALAIAVTFAIQPPTVWFVNVQLTAPGSALFAFLLTFWFYGPIITVGLALLRRIRPMLPDTRLTGTGRVWHDRAVAAAVAVVSGLIIAAVAVPFHEGVLGLPTDVERFGFGSAMLLAVSNAVTDELLLRLFLFTTAFVLAARYLPRRSLAVGTAVAVATLGDLLLHAPGLGELGLPGLGIVLSYGLARLALPAVLFGYLYWRRGLGTALTAHATAGVALGLLVL